MISLHKMLKQKGAGPPKKEPDNGQKQISVRDKLLVKEVQEMEDNLPKTCRLSFKDKDNLAKIHLTIAPEEGFWVGGSFLFLIDVPKDYNIMPPSVFCLTRIWHPNIDENGEVCLSLLRQSSLDNTGWFPTRQLKDVVWGLNSLFTDLLNFDDPLNVEAAEHYERDKDSFRSKVKEYIQKYAKR